MKLGRTEIAAVEFFVLGDTDNERDACGVVTSKALLSDGMPVAGGLYDAHMGTSELGWDCQCCFNTKRDCPGHDGMARLNYPVQNPVARREIEKVLRVVCHDCGALLIDRELGGPAAGRLMEMQKIVRSGTERNRTCTQCAARHPWVVRDRIQPGVLRAEWYGANRRVPERTEPINNNRIAEILGRVSDATAARLGRPLASHPSKYVVSNIRVPAIAIRPPVNKIGGNRSTMSDITVALRHIFEINSQIPSEMPRAIDKDLQDKLVLLDATFYDMIQGAADADGTGRPSNSIAARLPTKQGRLRFNLMGKRTRSTMRSVITGDKALRPTEIGVPRMIAQSMFVPETVRSWNRERLTMYYLNGPRRYPGCSKIRRADTGYEHYVGDTPSEYTLRDGDTVYRHLTNGDIVAMLREPALLYSNITALTVRVVDGFTLRINSSICALFNKS